MYECRNVEMGRTKGYWDEWTKVRKDKITKPLNFEKMTGQKNEGRKNPITKECKDEK